MSSFFGSIDLTRLGQIVRQHPELVKSVNMKDGTQHQFINIDVNEKQQADQYGNTAYVKVACKKEQQKQHLNYYLCDLRPSQYGNQQQSTQQKQEQPAAVEDPNNLPF